MQNSELRKFPLALCALCVLCASVASLAPLRIGTGMPALVFGAATSDRVDHASASSLDNFTELTWYAWVYPTTNATNRTLFAKEGGVGDKLFQVCNNGGSCIDTFKVLITRATTSASGTATNGWLTLNGWNFVAVVYSASGNTLSACRGTLTSAVSCTSLTGGAGTTADDSAGSLIIGNRPGATASFQGRIAMSAYWNRTMTTAELEAQRMRPFCKSSDGCKLFT